MFREESRKTHFAGSSLAGQVAGGAQGFGCPWTPGGLVLFFRALLLGFAHGDCRMAFAKWACQMPSGLRRTARASPMN